MSLLTVRGLTKRFGGLVALDGVDFHIEPGEIVGLIGPNGAGKSTLINTITGIYPPDAGEVRFEGHNLAGLSPDRVTHLGIARTFQIPQPFPSLSCIQNVTVGLIFSGKPCGLEDAAVRAQALLDFVGLGGKASAPLHNLTIVELRKLELARALAAGARLLLLDEINAGLTPSEIDEAVRLIRQVREGGTAILMVEHLMRIIMAVCARIIVLDFGRKIAEGTPDEVASHPEVIRAYLGERRGGPNARS
ncbi:MAG: ABC transporter ATP-binding protein [Armatimonadota bacterium]